MLILKAHFIPCVHACSVAFAYDLCTTDSKRVSQHGTPVCMLETNG